MELRRGRGRRHLAASSSLNLMEAFSGAFNRSHGATCHFMILPDYKKKNKKNLAKCVFSFGL